MTAFPSIVRSAIAINLITIIIVFQIINAECADTVLRRLCSVSAVRKGADRPCPSTVIEFEDVVTVGDEQHDVCRMFLACLQLANNGNVSIARTVDRSENAVGIGFSMLLLDPVSRGDIENYRAPSLKHTIVQMK